MKDYTKVVFQEKESQDFDEGLKAYMIKVYNYMAFALLITGTMAFATIYFEPLTKLIYHISPNGLLLDITSFGMIVQVAPLIIAIIFFLGLVRMTLETAQILFWVYAGLMGISLSSLGFIYTGQSLVRTFFICAAIFSAMSIYGYTTKKDLTSTGSLLVMGLIGLILVSLVNLFLRSPAVYFATSLIGVAIFVGLTAWDTQRLKSIYFYSGGGEKGQKLSIIGAFTLYLDFINLFLNLLRFLGKKKE